MDNNLYNLNDLIKTDSKKLEISSDLSPFSLSFRIKNFVDEKDEVKFIRNCEGLVRKSNEYKMWKRYLIDIFNMQECIITHERMEEVSIEAHHHIPSLFGLVKCVTRDFIQNDKEFSTFDICLKTMELHFENIIGICCLITSLHDKFHNGFLQIPIELVSGNYKIFLEKYLNYLDDEEIDNINDRLNIHLKDTSYTWSKDNYPGLVMNG